MDNNRAVSNEGALTLGQTEVEVFIGLDVGTYRGLVSNVHKYEQYMLYSYHWMYLRGSFRAFQRDHQPHKTEDGWGRKEPSVHG